MSVADVTLPEDALSQEAYALPPLADPLDPLPVAAAVPAQQPPPLQPQQQQPAQQQLPQQQQQQQQMVGHSHVNGRGLWRSWQRSFRQPLDALLDLIDNAFDANRGHGRIRISTTTPNQSNTVAENGIEQEGILLLNSFPQDKYKEMSEILEVFKSEKDDLAIGENGVGVKQASASLSNFTLVVTKKGARFQIGILCVSLQKPEGIVIPSYTLECDSWEHELDFYCDNDETFNLCMQYLGGRRVPPLQKDNNEAEEVPMEEDTILFLHNGKDRLLQLLEHVYRADDWKDHGCVFALWLDQVRTKESSVDILNGLKETLPKKYLHLQKPECDILINGVEPQFQYWERRLLELTCFSILISKTEPLGVNPDAPTENTNRLRIFVGFDPVRVNSSHQSCACLYIYSRECGRLVKYRPDCRHDLSLPSGGTQYAQGLTIILDDYGSSLPLTPTKQDIAWSDGENGPVHETNIMAWLRGCSRYYYDYVLSFFDNKKGELNNEVRRHVNMVKTWTNTEDSLTPLSEFRSFSKMTGLYWRMTGKNLVTPKQGLGIQHGEATVMQINVTAKPTKRMRSPDEVEFVRTNKRTHVQAAQDHAKRLAASQHHTNNGPAFGNNSAFANTSWPGTQASQPQDSLGSVGATPQPTSVLSAGALGAATPAPVTSGGFAHQTQPQHQPQQQQGSSRTVQWYESKLRTLASQVQHFKAKADKAQDMETRHKKATASLSLMQSENKRLEQEAAALRQRNRQLEEENQGMKQELDQKNEQLLILEESMD